MTIDAFCVIAICPKSARRHAGHILECFQFVLVGRVKMIMSAVVAIRAIVAQVMNIAHVDFLDTFHLVFIIFYVRIHTLVISIAGYLISSLCCGRFRSRRRRSNMRGG